MTTTTMAEILSKDREKQQQDQEPDLQLKQGSKVFSKLFSRESSAAAPSFRVYYGVASAGSVPFLWESQPGTPKNDAVSAATLLPPLTPPPSYFTAKKQAAANTHKVPAATTGSWKKKQCKHTSFFGAILPKIILHRRSRSMSSGSPTACSCSLSSSSSSSSASLSFRSAQSAASTSSMRSRVFAFSSVGDVDSSEEEQAPPTCFNVRHESFRALKSCRVATTVRSALASVGGHHGTTTAAAAQRV